MKSQKMLTILLAIVALLYIAAYALVSGSAICTMPMS